MTRPISLLKWQACQDIDKLAGEVRGLFLSDHLGQQRVYQRKRAEAEAYLEAIVTDPDAVAGVYLQAEATRCGLTSEAVAERVLAAASVEDVTDPAIEAERVGGKDDVRAAADEAGVASARASSLAALQAIAQTLETP